MRWRRKESQISWRRGGQFRSPSKSPAHNLQSSVGPCLIPSTPLVPSPPPCLSPFVSLSRLPLERSTHSFYGDSNAIFQQCGRWPGQGHVEGEGERSGGAAAGTGGAAAGLSQGPSPLLRVSIGDASLRSIICVEYRYLSIYLLACGQLDV